ncbi:unnamed protein product [Oncorhynchus mykiss]|uniref:Uncharacterized protein n=1 Tax=Oncorhynchus mykiss TaxID=8022 RepID=A0A060YVF4_ONCMY|nr:unnamed protein product [Oncorhynchus mykiss]
MNTSPSPLYWSIRTSLFNVINEHIPQPTVLNSLFNVINEHIPQPTLLNSLFYIYYVVSLVQSKVLSSQSLDGQSSSSHTLSLSSDWLGPDLLTTGLTQVLAVLAQAETNLLWRHQEAQEAAASLRRLGEERAGLEQRVRQLETDTEERQKQSLYEEQELTHIQDMLLSEREMVGSLRSQLEEEERQSEERRKENDRLRLEREREEEQRNELESDRQRRYLVQVTVKLL